MVLHVLHNKTNGIAEIIASISHVAMPTNS